MQYLKSKKLKVWVLVCILLASSVLPVAVQDAKAAGVVLKQGDRNGYVWDLQHRLQQLGYYTQNMDGIFGQVNKNAVVRFQRNYGLSADGIVGSKTWAALRKHTYTKNEIEMLAKIVHGEARGESFEGQVAVAAVVLNRVKSSGFPNTVKGVIFEPRAFTAIDDGQYYLSPDRDAYRAVYYAIRGWDPSRGALFYFNPQTATSSWIWSRPQITQIGKHIFSK